MSKRTPSKRKKVYIIILVLNHNKELLKNSNEICQKSLNKNIVHVEALYYYLLRLLNINLPNFQVWELQLPFTEDTPDSDKTCLNNTEEWNAYFQTKV